MVKGALKKFGLTHFGRRNGLQAEENLST